MGFNSAFEGLIITVFGDSFLLRISFGFSDDLQTIFQIFFLLLNYNISLISFCHACGGLRQCFSSTGPRPGTGPWHQLYRAARGSPGFCHFSFLSSFHEYMFYSGNILRRKVFLNV